MSVVGVVARAEISGGQVAMTVFAFAGGVVKVSLCFGKAFLIGIWGAHSKDVWEGYSVDATGLC